VTGSVDGPAITGFGFRGTASAHRPDYVVAEIRAALAAAAAAS
jgi:hypothetical protein